MPKSEQPKSGTRDWHELQIRECLTIAQELTKKSNDYPSPDRDAMRAVQITCQAIVHALLMLNPELVLEEYAEKENNQKADEASE